MTSTIDTKDVQFYEFTGRTLVFPITYELYDFQKEIIKTAIFHNTLISLPSGLGKSLLAAVITFNFHRWFTRGKIVILSQTRSYLTDQISAYTSYTTLSDEAFGEIPASASDDDCEAACELPIILSSPQKFLSCLTKNLYRVRNLILLIVFETSKISKCQEYQEIIMRLNVGEFRLLTFIDPIGMNSKIIKQIVEVFKISKLKIKNLDSPEIKKCTFTAEIESITVDITRYIMNIKDSFFTVFEKYGKKLKDAKIINGNVVTLTRAQVQKCKEKFLKNPPQNLSKEERDDLVNSMTMCAFLCYGIELLHNWGVRAFYHYLFDSKKDDDLKMLMKNDELLSKQMSLLDEYLKSNGKKIDSTLSRIMHPKLLKLKNTVNQLFCDAEVNIDQLRIIIISPIEYVINDIEQLFSSLPDVVRCQIVKTKAKCLCNDPLYKETIENFKNGVINVLVMTNIVDEIMGVKSSVIISLEPIKALFKFSDPKFFETTKKCLFIVTKGLEENKFEAFLHEKRNEQKYLDVSGLEEPIIENSNIFPEGFDPKFECSSVRELKKHFRNSPGQKSILQFFNSKLAASSPALKELGTSSKKSKSSLKSFGDESRSIFADDFSSSNHSKDPFEEPQPVSDSYFEDPLPYLPDPSPKLSPVGKAFTRDIDDTFDDLIFDFTSDSHYSKQQNSIPTKNTSSPSLVANVTSPVLSSRSKFSWSKKKSQKINSSLLKSLGSDSSHSSDSLRKPQKVFQSKKSRSCDIGLEDLPNVSFVDDLFSESSNSEASDHEERNRSVKEKIVPKKNYSNVAFPEESFGDFVFSENSVLLKNQPILVGLKGSSSENKNSVKKADPSMYFKSSENYNNNDPKTINAQKYGAVVEDRPLFSDAEDDLFEDISWLDSRCKSSKTDIFAKYRPKNNESSANMTSFSNAVPTHPPKSMSTAFDSSSDFSRLKTIEESSRSRIPDVSLTEIPSEFLDDFVPASPPQEIRPCDGEKCKNLTLDTSPVLFSSKKSNRKLFSNLRRNGDSKKGTSVKFDSFLDVSKENLQHVDKKIVTSLADKENEIDAVKMVPSTPPGADYEFDSILFDNNDAIFINDITSKGLNIRTDKAHDTTDKEVNPKVNKNLHIDSKKLNDEEDRLSSSSTSPSLFDLCNYDTANKTSVVEATVTVPPRKKLQLYSEAINSPLGQKNGVSLLNRTSRPFRDTPKSSIVSFRKRSTPLFDESDNNFESPPRPFSALRPALQSKIASLTSSSTAEKKKRIFSNFTESVRQKLSISGSSNDVTRVEETKAIESTSIIDATDDDFPWLRKSSPTIVSNRLSCFKKPEEPVVRSRYSLCNGFGTPGSLTDGSEMASTPTPPNKRRPMKKRSRLKRNLAEQFIDAEAEVTDDDEEDDNEDCDFANDCIQFSDDSFIDDDSSAKPENISKYLKSVKSPNVPVGKFRIPMLTEKQLKVNVYSQAVENDQTYENDSFCVDEDEPEPDDTYVPSVLTQMEERLSKRRVEKVLPKTKQFKRIRIIDDSSPDSPTVRQNQRKRIKHISSDSED